MKVHNADMGSKVVLVPARKGQPPDVRDGPVKPQMAEVHAEGTTTLLTNRLKEMVTTASSVDERRVDQVAHAIRDGNYPIDPEKVAKKFVQLELWLP